jgi:hypothetical protein
LDSGASEKLGNDLAGLLATLGSNSLKALSIVAFDAHDDRELCVGIALVYLDLTGAGAINLSVEVAGLRIGVCPGIFSHVN